MSDSLIFKEPLAPQLLTILEYPNEKLRTVCAEVTEITPEFQRFGRDMLFTLMNSKEGVGLAAPQVGMLFRVIVMAIPGKKPAIMFNPKIVNSSKSVLTKQEGCLSFPGTIRSVTRPKWVSVVYQDLTGARVRRKFHGLEAVCAQHEIEHLNGKLFNGEGPNDNSKL